MSFIAGLKGRQALSKHQKGEYEQARVLYEEAIQKGCNQPNVFLSYSILLLKSDEYEKAKNLLVKAEKLPGVTPEQKQQIHMHYAVAAYKLGDIEKALSLLERQHNRAPSGNIYGALGCIYIEAGEKEKALSYNQEALDYDEEDPVFLDNMGQTYYRLYHDKQKAKPYFERALKIKENQIDSLYFLAQYDIDDQNYEAAREKLSLIPGSNFSPLNYTTKEKVQASLDQIKSLENKH